MMNTRRGKVNRKVFDRKLIGVCDGKFLSPEFNFGDYELCSIPVTIDAPDYIPAGSCASKTGRFWMHTAWNCMRIVRRPHPGIDFYDWLNDQLERHEENHGITCNGER